jgi:hypothetical protein
MAVIDIDLKPDRRKLRQFGFIALVAFGGLAGLILWKGGLFGISFGEAANTVAYVLLGVGALSALFSLAYPPANRILFTGLIIVTFPIGIVISYVLMGFVFYVIFTPIALLFKLIGRDSLERRFDREAETYWVERKPVEGTKRYFKQF